MLYPDHTLFEGRGLWTLERFLCHVHQHYIISIACDDARYIFLKKIFHWRCSLFSIKQPRNSIVRGTGHMAAESAQPRKRPNVTRPLPSKRVESGDNTMLCIVSKATQIIWLRFGYQQPHWCLSCYPQGNLVLCKCKPGFLISLCVSTKPCPLHQ